jgi:outer membrane protein TolC
MTIAALMLYALLVQERPGPPPSSDPLLAPLPAEGSMVVRSFDEGLAELRRGSDTLEIAAARARAAAAQSGQALAALLPLVDASASASYDLLHPGATPVAAGLQPAAAASGVSGGGSPLAVGQLTARVPLIDVSLWRTRAAVKAGQAASEAALADTERTLVLGLASTLIGVLSAERVVQLAQLGLSNALEREHLVTRTVELGTGTRLDLVRAQQDTRLARADVLSARERALQAREALGLLLGRAGAAGVAAGLNLEQGFETSRRLCRSVATAAARPDVRAARLQQAAREAQTAAARAEYFPSLGLQSALSAVSARFGPVRVPSWTVSAVLSVPLWDSGGRSARVDEQRWLALAARREADQVEREAGADRVRALRGVQVAGDLLAEAQVSRDLAQEADRMTRRSFEVGAATSLEMVQSAQLLRQAELALAARQFELQTARFGALIAEASCALQ